VNSPVNNTNRSTPSRYGPGRRGRQEPMQFFTVAEVAEHLGVSTRTTVRRWIDDELLVAHRMNGVVRISEADSPGALEFSAQTLPEVKALRKDSKMTLDNSKPCLPTNYDWEIGVNIWRIFT
jgi:excisionase family DNA binding protein